MQDNGADAALRSQKTHPHTNNTTRPPQTKKPHTPPPQQPSQQTTNQTTNKPIPPPQPKQKTIPRHPNQHTPSTPPTAPRTPKKRPPESPAVPEHKRKRPYELARASKTTTPPTDRLTPTPNGRTNTANYARGIHQKSSQHPPGRGMKESTLWRAAPPTPHKKKCLKNIRFPSQRKCNSKSHSISLKTNLFIIKRICF